MIEVGRVAGHRHAVSGRWLLLAAPAFGGRDVDGGNDFRLGLRQRGFGPLPASIGCLLGVPPQAARSVERCEEREGSVSIIVDLRRVLSERGRSPRRRDGFRAGCADSDTGARRAFSRAPRRGRGSARRLCLRTGRGQQGAEQRAHRNGKTAEQDRLSFDRRDHLIARAAGPLTLLHRAARANLLPLDGGSAYGDSSPNVSSSRPLRLRAEARSDEPADAGDGQYDRHRVALHRLADVARHSPL